MSAPDPGVWVMCPDSFVGVYEEHLTRPGSPGYVILSQAYYPNELQGRAIEDAGNLIAHRGSYPCAPEDLRSYDPATCEVVPH